MTRTPRHDRHAHGPPVTLLDVALAYTEAGCSVVPVATDGTKMPDIRWAPYQQERPTLDQIAAWFGTDHYDGLGLVCGAVSGHLEMFELEGRSVADGILTRLADAMAEYGYGELWETVTAGHAEITPSGGLHWLYRVDGTARRNTKLARRPSTPDELAEWKAGEHAKADLTIEDPTILADRHAKIDSYTAEQVPQVLIETRGEGGFTVLAPSAGRTHPSGKPWMLVRGGINAVPTISEADRDALYAVAGTLDEMPPPPEHTPKVRSADSTAERPGDAYNANADWSDILIPHGWTEGKRLGESRTWRRPGKGKGDGISATTGRNDGDNLYVFSSSTEFETEKAYSKFAAYTLLNHGGDYAAAAKALRSDGYGAPLEPSRPADQLAGIIAPAVDGSSALAPVRDIRTAERPLAAVDERTLDRSDDGNALLLVQRFGDRIRYCHDRGKWLAWDGQRWHWSERGGGVVREYAKRVARSLPEDDQPALNHKRRSLGAIGTSAMLAQAATDSRISVALGDLDANPWELNTPAGIVDLRSGELLPADPAKLHTRMTTCAPDPTANPGTWQTFLADTFGADQSLIGYLQRLVGYSAVGLVGPHVLPFCHGSGGNGKGVFLEALAKVLGDYATTAPSGFLMATSHAKHETEIARLAGARMVLCSEVNEDDHFDEAKVKQLTGGDTLTARFMQQDHFTFVPTHQLWLMGNHKPAVRSGGRSFWRRLRLVPFEHEVPDHKAVDDLQGILAADHGPALLAWIVSGAAQYAAGGLAEPASVKAATADYAHDQDTVTRFLEEQCLLGGGEHVSIKVTLVRAAYERWCADAGEVPVSAKAFGIAMGKRGVGTRRTPKARLYVGLSLLSGDDDTASDVSDSADDQGWR